MDKILLQLKLYWNDPILFTNKRKKILKIRRYKRICNTNEWFTRIKRKEKRERERKINNSAVVFTTRLPKQEGKNC